tara:strand:+ start:2282 stop:2677 length:396 start_codon:yes stop_codon:yes gene_type:complete
MNKPFLKKVIAQSPEDLQIISACCSGGLVKIGEIKYLPKSKIFLLSVKRFDKESDNENRLNSIIRFEYVEFSRSKNINQVDPNIELELISIDFFKKNQNYEITLLFSNNRFITLGVEAIEVFLEDQKEIND